MIQEKFAVVVEPAPYRAQQIVEALKDHYKLVYRAESDDLLGRQTAFFLDSNSDSIDVVVIQASRCKPLLIDRVIGHKLPFVLIYTELGEVDPKVARQIAQSGYKPGFLQWAPENLNRLIEVINEAKH